MHPDMKKIYIYVAKFKKSPMNVFQDWNRVKEAANRENVDLPEGTVLYPEYVRMLMRYRNETTNGP